MSGFRFVVGRGNDRYVEDVVQSGKEAHTQRRKFKAHIGLLQAK